MVAVFAFTLAWAYAVLWYVFLIGIVAPALGWQLGGAEVKCLK